MDEQGNLTTRLGVMADMPVAALAAADVIIVPVACEGEAYDQLERLDAIITGRINPRLRPGQRINWIIPTRANPQRCLDRDVLHTHYPGRVTPAVREAVIVRDSYLDGKPVSCYAPGHPVTDDYHKALTPVLKEVQCR